MHTYDYLIIGGGASGISAVETIRSKDKSGSIAVVSDETTPLYSRVMLSKPNYFLGKIPADQIFLKDKNWYSENDIDFLPGKKAVGLDAKMHEVALSDGSHLHYKRLLIATGVDARRIQVPGADKKGVHYLRNLDDGKGIMQEIKTVKTAVTIGGGFISFEMADLLRSAGLDTTLILRESYFWEPTLDIESGTMIENALTKAGVKIIKNTEVIEISGSESVRGITLRDGTRLSADLVICGIGVISPTEWLKESGVDTGHGIIANEYLETSAPDVWTAGDIAEYDDLLLEEHVQMGNWVNAREQGRIAGLNMVASLSTPPDPRTAFKFVSFYTTSGFGISVAFVGDVTPSPGRTYISRGSSAQNSYARILVDHDEIEGATLINRIGDMNPISKLISSNTKVSGKENILSDGSFDLKSLL